MLLQFTVENFACFAERVVLSFLAVPTEDHPEGQVVDVPGVGPVLRSVVLYGPNASGKSNLLRALNAATRLATDGVRPGQPVGVAPHKLDPKWLAEPTTFELELVTGEVHYAYGLRATTAAVVEEWLHRVGQDRSTPIFERDAAGIVMGDGLELGPERLAFYRFVAEGTRPEQPFLAELGERNATELVPLRAWLSRANLIPPEVPTEVLSLFFANPDVVERVGALLREAGTGVDQLRLLVRDEAAQRRLDSGLGLDGQSVDRLLRAGSANVLLLHRTTTGGVAALDLNEVSDGTRRLILAIAPASVLASGATFLSIDELDRSFHTELSRFVVRRLHREATRTQFLFTTHDTNLLDAGVFGRDAIWFVDKDSNGASRLYSLAEFDRDQLEALSGHIEEGYLQGRFGALPTLTDASARSRRARG